MKKLTAVFIACLTLSVAQAYAGNGDLIVNGNLGVSTTSPDGKLNTAAAGTYNGTNIDTYSTGGYYSMLNLRQSNNDTLGVLGASVYNRYLGAINFQGVRSGQGAFFYGAGMYAVTTGAAGPVYIPTNLIFETSTNSDRNPNQLVLSSNGNTLIGTSDAQNFKLYVEGSLYATSGPWGASDAKFKKNLLPIITPLDKVLNLNGLTYEWKTDEYKDKNFPDGRHYGVIAQEVEKVLPEVVKTDSKGDKSVAYTEIIPVLIEAIKEQQKRIEQLEKNLTELNRN
jgi:hypothetical protein